VADCPPKRAFLQHSAARCRPYPEFIDGGGVTAPRFAIYGLNGEWEVENRGVAPDYEVELDPKAQAEGLRSAIRARHQGGDGRTGEETDAQLQTAAISELPPAT
jgi:hypothetical protein